jgi:DNA-directed RNA polymerase beta' subunit
MKLLNTEKFANSPESGPNQTRDIKTAKTFTRNADNELVPNSGSFYDPGIFGFSSREIFDQFASIKLQEPVLHPFIYKNIGKLGGLFNKCLNKSIKCVLVDGMLVDAASTGNPNSGSNGISFIINNFNKIKFDKYLNEKNKEFIELLKSDKDLIILKKIPVIPIGYRNYSNKHGMVEEDEITDIYKKIVNINEDKDWIKDLSQEEQSEFEDVIQSIYKNTSKKEYVQRYIQTLYEYFLDKLNSKDGFFNASLFGKRVDNVARYVANAQPDIPSDSAAFPWQGLLIMFDVFVIAYLNKPEYEEISKKLGTKELLLDEIGKQLEYIYRNTEEYLNNYQHHEELWIQLLTDIFNDNPEVRVITKRDPGWTPVSWWSFKPLILTGVQYQLIVPSLIYAPIGGDSFSSNFIIHDLYKDCTKKTVFENDEVSIKIPDTEEYKDSKVQKIYNSFSFLHFIGKNAEKEISNDFEDDFEKLMENSGIRKI